MAASSSTISFGIFLFVMIFIITMHWTILDFKSVDAQKESEIVVKSGSIQKESEIVINNTNIDEKNKLVVVSDIDLQNIDKIGFIKVVGVINGEGFVKNIPLDKIDETTKKLKVNFVMNKDNEINSAHKPDEFFVCAYHFINSTNSNIAKSISFDKHNDVILDYFDCNENDIKSTKTPTEANLFKANSQVFSKSVAYYNMYTKSKSVSFGTLGNDTINSITNNNNNLSNNDIKQNNTKAISDIGRNDNNNSNKSVKVKILAPMQDKKDAKKIKFVAMVKGQIKSEIVDVQKEFDKIGGYTIEREFAFDRNTDMGPIQVGDRFHACVIGEGLYPPEGSECEKRLIKYLDKPNTLAAR